jgi:hypothetical protein
MSAMPLYSRVRPFVEAKAIIRKNRNLILVQKETKGDYKTLVSELERSFIDLELEIERLFGAFDEGKIVQ